MSLRKNEIKSNYMIPIQRIMIYVRKEGDFGFISRDLFDWLLINKI